MNQLPTIGWSLVGIRRASKTEAYVEATQSISSLQECICRGGNNEIFWCQTFF